MLSPPRISLSARKRPRALVKVTRAQSFMLSLCLFAFYMFWYMHISLELLAEEVPSRENRSFEMVRAAHHKIQANKPQIQQKETLEESKQQNSLLKPLQILEQYKTWHSVESLERQPTGRSFAVAYYSCPLQAGNRLHHFFNGFLWAILTNRTLLWDYWDRDNCRGPYDKGICKNANTVEDCDRILERLSWIPSFREWSHRLNLKHVYQVPHWATHVNSSRPARGMVFRPSDTQFAGADVWLQNATYAKKVVAFAQTVAKSRVLESEKNRNYLLHSEYARSLALDLYSEGDEFLFGMLFRKSFRFANALLQETLASSGELPKDGFSIALHSRHSDPKNDGCNIDKEKACIDTVLGKLPISPNRSCHLFVMSDRFCTRKEISKYVKNCVVEMTHHQKTIRSWRREHGPYAGIGYYEDWILASRARSAFIGTSRSSSDLIREVIEYDRRVQAMSTQADTPNPLEYCKLHS